MESVPKLLGCIRQTLNRRLPMGVPVWALWGLAGASRCLRLTEGMLAQARSGDWDLIGVAARAHHETFLASIYLAHEKEKAHRVLAGDFKHYLEKLVKDLALTPPSTPSWLNDAAPARMSTWSLAEAVEDSLPKEHRLSGYATKAYRRLFAGESLFSSHGRVGAMIRQTVGTDDNASIDIVIDPRAETALASVDRVWEAASITGILAVDLMQAANEEVPADLSAAIDTIGVPAYP